MEKNEDEFSVSHPYYSYEEYYLRFDANENTRSLLQLPLVWEILCKIIPVGDDNSLEYIKEERVLECSFGEFSIHTINELNIRFEFTIDFDPDAIWDDNKLRFLAKMRYRFRQIQEYLPKAISLAIRYTKEKRDLNSLAIASKEFDPKEGYFNGYDTDATELDDNELKRRRLTGEIGQSKKSMALNIFAEHYYPDIIRKLEPGRDIVGEEYPIRRMNRIYSEQQFRRKIE